MKFHLNLNYKIKKGETVNLPVPNLKFQYLLPTVFEFHTHEQEFTLTSHSTPLFKYGEPYFRFYNRIDLNNFKNKIGEGEELKMTIKNLSKQEFNLDLIIIYEKQYGNIIYSNSYSHSDMTISKCLEEIADAGQITRLIIKSEYPMKSVILDPLYTTLDASSDSQNNKNYFQNKLFQNWAQPLEIKNEPSSVIVDIDMTQKDLKNYVRLLKFYRLKLLYANSDQNSPDSKTYVLAYGYKPDK